MNSNQKRPLTPQQLFNRLIQNTYKEAECQDQSAKLQQQRQILLQLIVEYQDQIKKGGLMAMEERRLAESRERLMGELEALKNQRAMIDARLQSELTTLRSQPVDEAGQRSWAMDINESRGRNNRLRIRIKDLMCYIEKLQKQNRRLQEERRIIQVSEVQRKQGGQDWRGKINLLQKQYFSYETDLREGIRVREQEAIRNIQTQELQIQERNKRRRMQSLSGRLGTPITPVAGLGSRYIRQI